MAADPEAVLSGIFEKNLELWGFIASNVGLLAVLRAYAPGWVSFIITGMLGLFGWFAVKGGKKQYEARAEVTFHRRRASYYEEIMGKRAMDNERMLFHYAGEMNDRFLEESRKVTQLAAATEIQECYSMEKERWKGATGRNGRKCSSLKTL